MFNKILCPVDGSDHAHKALDLAIDLAGKYDAELVILHVPQPSANVAALRRFAEVERLAPQVNLEIDRLKSIDFRTPLPSPSSFEDAAISSRLLIEIGEFIVDGAKAEAESRGLERVVARIENGDPADRILDCVENEGVDCVIMGSRGLNDFKGLFMGSVSHKVANRAHCTCISVK